MTARWWPPLLAAACLGLTGWLVTAGPFGLEGPTFLLLALGAVWLEWTAVSLPGYGLFSAGAACTLALGLLPQGQAAGALVAWLTLGGRAAVIARGSLEQRTALALGDLFSVLLAIAIANRLPAEFGLWLAPLAYAGVQTGLRLGLAGLFSREQRLTARPAQRLAAPLVLAVGLAAPALCLLVQEHWSYVLWLGAGLGAVHQAAANLLYRLAGEGVGQVHQQLHQSRRELDQVEQRLEMTQAERDLLERFVETTARAQGVEATLELVVSSARELGGCADVAVWLVQAGKLVPARALGPQAEKVMEAPLLGLRDALCEGVLAQARPLMADQVSGPKLFEEKAVAFPLADHGVLCLGRRRPFTALDVKLLGALAKRAALALEAARLQESMAAALNENQRSNVLLQAWVKRLQWLLEGSRRLAYSLDPQELLESLADFLGSSIPHQSGLVASLGLHHLWGDEPPALEAVITQVEDFGKPLFYPDLASSPFGLTGSLLAVPLGSHPGVLVLYHGQPNQFGSEQLDLLQVYGLQAGLALAKAGTYRQLEESQAQLVQSSKMAAVGQLAAGVAHELNSPLGAILLALDGAEGLLSKPERVRKKIGRARRASLRAREIIENLLIYSRPEQAAPQSFQVNEVVGQAVDFLAHQLELDGVTVELALGDLPAVRGFPNQLHQVLVNLALNARDALREQSERRLWICTRRQAQEIVIEVRDNGPGVDPALADQIFDPFFTTKEIGHGTGLGLAVSHRIVVERHQGRLELSPEGPGAGFLIALPALTA